MTQHTKTGQGVGKIRWYHWAVYRLFRRVWNPILRDNPSLAIGFAKHITMASLPISDRDNAAIEALVKRRLGELKVHRLSTTPRVAP
jgi:hypothetical protein